MNRIVSGCFSAARAESSRNYAKSKKNSYLKMLANSGYRDHFTHGNTEAERG